MLQHEVHLLGCDQFGSDDQVAFVLTVLIIDDNDEFASLEVFNGLLYGVHFDILHLSIPYYILYKFCNTLILGCEFNDSWQYAIGGRADGSEISVEPESEADHTEIEEDA